MHISATRRSLYLFFLINGALFVLCILYVGAYRYAAARGLSWFGCTVRDAVGIYCPTCGFSRALHALFSLRIGQAFLYYPPLFVAPIPLCDLDIRLLSHSLRGTRRTPMVYRSKWLWLLIPAAMLVLFILRLFLVLGMGTDPLGDLTAL